MGGDVHRTRKDTFQKTNRAIVCENYRIMAIEKTLMMMCA
jgi:hypothetical protein